MVEGAGGEVGCWVQGGIEREGGRFPRRAGGGIFVVAAFADGWVLQQ